MKKIQKIEDSKNFMEGYQTLRQLSFGILDMSYHAENVKVEDVKTFEIETIKATQVYPTLAETAVSTSFSHIFQGGYSGWILFLQVGRSFRCRCFSIFSKKMGL